MPNVVGVEVSVMAHDGKSCVRRKMVRLDPITYAIFKEVASSYGISLEECVTQQLYRDGANMAGWPGNLGSVLRSTVLEEIARLSGEDLPSPGIPEIP